ncbi:hypothetical protein ACVNHC_13305 [Pannonibacter sp. Q-1]|uniref:Uncharacterized protein n=1 Tax=Pannonibacter phragmitetus TaxID=121719 RepID=A0A0L0J1B9_9HYPH|nr:hypothetical protein [Pannonibacter phragmitetus]ALV28495.1 hypothetical protein APZ00_16660 [Pannonibacter phragmitetus]KND19412.1 hypothetical protein ADZ37_10530 [Pannonibacter phragmitetus]MBA4207176.1 hypothetical protein [Polymorphum sp.]
MLTHHALKMLKRRKGLTDARRVKLIERRYETFGFTVMPARAHSMKTDPPKVLHLLGLAQLPAKNRFPHLLEVI